MTFAAAMGPSLLPPLAGVAVRAGACAEVTVADAFASALDGILATTATRAVPVAETSVSVASSGRLPRSEAVVSEPAAPHAVDPSATVGAPDLVVLPATSSVPAAVPPRVAIDDASPAPDSPEPEGAPPPSETPAPVASTSTPAAKRNSAKTIEPDLAAPTPAMDPAAAVPVHAHAHAHALVGIVPAAGPSVAYGASDTPFAQPTPAVGLSGDAADERSRSDAGQSLIDAIAAVAVDVGPDAVRAPGLAVTPITSAVRGDGPVIVRLMPEVPTVVDAEVAAAPDQPPVANSTASPRAWARGRVLAEKPATRERSEGVPGIGIAQTVPMAPAIQVAAAPTDVSDPPKLRADDRAIVGTFVGDDASPATNAGPTNGQVLPIPIAPALRPSAPEAPLPRVVAAPHASPGIATPPMAPPAKTSSMPPEPVRGAQILANALQPGIAAPPSRGPAPVDSGRRVTTASPMVAAGGTTVRGGAAGPRSVPDDTLDVGDRVAVLPSTLAAQVVPVESQQVLENAPVSTPFAQASVGGVRADSMMAPGTGPAEPVQSAEFAEPAGPAGPAEIAVSAAPDRVDLAMASARTVQASWIDPVAVAPVVVSQQAEGSNDARASRSVAPARDLSSTASRPFAAPSNPVDARRPDGRVEAGDRTGPDVRLRGADAALIPKPKAKGVALADAASGDIEKIRPDGFVVPQAADPVSAASAPPRAMAPPLGARQAVADMPVVVAQPGRIGQDMGVAIVHRLSAGEQELVVRLEPAALGRIEVRMAFDDQRGLRAVIAADSPVALDMLRRDSADLARALNDAGIRNDGQSLRFQTDGNGGGNSGGQPRNPWLSGDRASDRSTADRGVADDPLPYRQVRLGGRYDLMA